MLKTANSTLKSPKEIATFSTHKASLLPMATSSLLHDLNAFPILSSRTGPWTNYSSKRISPGGSCL